MTHSDQCKEVFDIIILWVDTKPVRVVPNQGDDMYLQDGEGSMMQR